MNERMNRTKFFGLLRGLPHGDLVQIQTAYWLTKNAHRLQAPRDNGDRYFEHPREVAISLIQRGYRDKDLISTALLHDVLEDSNTPPQVIVDLFPNVIWERLYILSKYVPIFDPITGQIYDRVKKPTDVYFAAIASADEKTQLVKVADRLHNLSSMESWTPERRQRYFEETKQHILPIAEKVDPWFFKKISEAIALG